MNRTAKWAILLLLYSTFFAGRKQKVKYMPGSQTVAVVKSNEQYRLFRNGQPYYIKGVNITDIKYLYDAKVAGANAVRIYNTDHAQEILDSAYKLGLTVLLGLAMEYADKDMNYSNHEAVARQLERIRRDVKKYKNHPALLMWGVGNEPNLFFEDKPTRILGRIDLCNAINNIAKMIHETDSNHPTIMMVTGGSTNRLNTIFCDEIDIIGYNSFESFENQKRRSYWKGPYIVSEFGAPAYWSGKATEWYNYREPTSFEKGAFIKEQYKSFQSDTANCLGAYAFIWGQKQEYTSTWFSLYTDDGTPTTMTEEIRSLWTGRPPSTKLPLIQSLRVDNKPDADNIYLKSGSRYTAVFNTVYDSLNPAQLRWEIQPDMVQYLEASYLPQRQAAVDSGVVVLPPVLQHNEYKFEFTAPVKEGPFRLFLYVKDASQKAATANACIYVYK